MQNCETNVDAVPLMKKEDPWVCVDGEAAGVAPPQSPVAAPPQERTYCKCSAGFHCKHLGRKKLITDLSGRYLRELLITKKKRGGGFSVVVVCTRFGIR